MMMADVIAQNAGFAEKSTPSPHAYIVDREKLLPRLDKGGASLL